MALRFRCAANTGQSKHQALVLMRGAGQSGRRGYTIFHHLLRGGRNRTASDTVFSGEMKNGEAVRLRRFLCDAFSAFTVHRRRRWDERTMLHQLILY
jgi:hypothetical protein